MIAGGFPIQFPTIGYLIIIPELFSTLFFVALGQASVKTIYKVISILQCVILVEKINWIEKYSAGIFISVIGIAFLYLAMNISVVSVIPGNKLRDSNFIVSTFIEKIYGHQAAVLLPDL